MIRLDTLISKQFGISRSEAVRWIDAGCIFYNNEPLEQKKMLFAEDTFFEKKAFIAKPQIVAETISSTQEIISHDALLDIVYEDDFFLVINKPAGIVVHPGAGKEQVSIVSILRAYLGAHWSDLDPERPGIVHRLDKDTSGLLLIGKTQEVVHLLSKLFEAREITKKYQALVIGGGLPKQGTIDAPIVRDYKDRVKMEVSVKPTARQAVTHFDVIQEGSGFSFVDCHIITGRTHQIRVHFSSIGHPVIGDPLYGNSVLNRDFQEKFGLKRQFLHATTMSFVHPKTQELVHFTSELPEDLQFIYDQLYS